MPGPDNEETINTGVFTGRMRKLASDAPQSVLVVDDDPLELELIADRLELAGLRVVRASQGQEALEILDREAFSVVILDWQMPVMNGIELTEHLRTAGKDEIYIIMLTSRDSGFDYDRGYFAGVDDYLSKKLPDTELLSRIHSAFSTVGLRRELKKARARIAQLEAGGKR